MEKQEFDNWLKRQQDKEQNYQLTKKQIETKLEIVKENGRQAAEQLKADGIDPSNAEEELKKMEQDLKEKMDNCASLLQEIDKEYQDALKSNPS